MLTECLSDSVSLGLAVGIYKCVYKFDTTEAKSYYETMKSSA